MNNKSYPYTESQCQFILENGAFMSTKDLTDSLNLIFRCNHTYQSVRTVTKRLGIRKSKETMHNIRSQNDRYPIGTTKVIDRYEYVKAYRGKPGGFFSNWIRKSNIVWMEHNGEIPEGHFIIFLNGNTLDSRIENLACVSNAVMAKMVNGHGKSLYSECPEITKTGILVCQLDIEIGRSR